MPFVRATAYSSSANLGAGFDVLSLAHQAYKDVVEAEIVGEGKSEVVIQSNSDLPLDPLKNSAGAPVLNLLNEMGLKYRVKLRIHKGVPYGLGLGSSGASAVAAVAALNSLLNLKLSLEEVVRYATAGEKAVSGSPHPDNVAASAFGGVVAVVSTSPVRIVTIPVRLNFKITLIVPRIHTGEGKTKRARELVPKQVDIGKMVENMRYLSSFVLGITKGDRELTRMGLNDEIVEKSREPLFPYYPKIREIALRKDAVGVCVSGAGPTILVLSDEETDLEGIKREVSTVCNGFETVCDFVDTQLGGGVETERFN
ncbi:homoserine kinase [Metallosphaera tengchongensis]|uniref:Homoserine kinase n=1 Tax=Metallosphaera tengchongensis TaxID=1532350 RepID=A0A6N0NZC6_9CREN|nr:homoserine kinase [Metallosphaera tengchongensis]QKR00491.1 homoserine kinase [Metallosphaera tengchongensis]